MFFFKVVVSGSLDPLTIILRKSFGRLLIKVESEEILTSLRWREECQFSYAWLDSQCIVRPRNIISRQFEVIRRCYRTVPVVVTRVN